MAMHLPFITLNKQNRRLMKYLVIGCLIWSFVVYGLWCGGQLLEPVSPLWTGTFVVLQVYAAAQLILPALLFQAEERTRAFYYFWGVVLALGIWLGNQVSISGVWQPLLEALKSGLLLLIAILAGAVLARYVERLWEIVPICLVMASADVASCLYGPTATFSRQIKEHYLAPGSPAPFVDMILIKVAAPGSSNLIPVLGISDWIMTVFFAIVAVRKGINDNLLLIPGEELARKGWIGLYLPISIVGIITALAFAQLTGLFLPALPVLALMMLIWYAVRALVWRLCDKSVP